MVLKIQGQSQVPQSNYDEIADEYYDARHITSRNFDNATKAALNDGRANLPSGLVLELGAGKGRSIEFLGIAPERIIHLDSSEIMLNLKERENCLLKIHADACSIPLSGSQFGIVVGFLIDPFFGLDCLAEAHRMLTRDGSMILTVPTIAWGKPLRQRIGIDVMTTRFRIIDRGMTVQVPSNLHAPEKIIEMLEVCGFREVSLSNICLPQSVLDVSPDISSVCKEKGVSNYELPIVHVIRAVK